MAATKHRKQDATPTPERVDAFIGAFVQSSQREKLRALAQLRGASVSAVLRSLIDDAAAMAAGGVRK